MKASSHFSAGADCARSSTPSRRVAVLWGCLLVGLAVMIATPSPQRTRAEETAAAAVVPHAGRTVDAARTMGLTRGDCKKCHPSEVSAWMKSTHYFSADLRLATYRDGENTKKYADALGVTRGELMTTSVCADCHGTKTIDATGLHVASGVSCEKCHGAAGGDPGWLNRHQSYHEHMLVPRDRETEQHRLARRDACEAAGMVRSANIYGLAKSCYTCHLINNEELVAAGHKLASAFEFVSWSEGEVRHNFLLNRDHNAPAPSLWLEATGGTAAQRRRLKFVTGALVQLEMSLRARASAKNAVIVPQLGGMVAAANGRLTQISLKAPVAEVQQANAIVTPLLGTLFAIQDTDASTYATAADAVAAQALAFLEQHDGSDLQALDELIEQTSPYFSQQFRNKYTQR